MDPVATQLTAFDGLILLVVIFSMLVGCARGFVREALGLSAWAGASSLALRDFAWAREFFAQWFQDPKFQQILGMASVFCFSLTVLLIAVQWLSYKVQGTMAHSVDRSLGLVFGFGRGLVFVCLGYLASLFMVLPEFQPPLVRLSKSYPWLNQSALFLNRHLPSALRTNSMLAKGIAMIRPPDLSSRTLAQELSTPQPALEELAPEALP